MPIRFFCRPTWAFAQQATLGLLGLGLFAPLHAASQDVTAAAVAWAAQAAGVSAQAIQSQPVDERLQLATCEQPLQVDAPFGDPARPRVRCAQPRWQVFVQLTLPAAPANTPAASPQATRADKPSPPPATRQVVMLTTHLARGTRLTPKVLSEQQVPAQQAMGGTLTQLEQAVGAELVRDIGPGRPLRRHDVRAAVLVKRGAMVQITIGQGQRFAISARLVAEQDGRMGQQIKLKNPDTGRVVMGRVVGSNEVVGL